MDLIALGKGLPDTKSRKLRSYDLVAINSALADYLLVFRQGKPGLKSYECQAYLVQAEPDSQTPFGMPGTYYLIAKLDPPEDDPDRNEVYRCFVPERKGEPGGCTCIGQNTQRVCKHADALCDATHSPVEVSEACTVL